jgi:cytochrome c oxidase subunit II
MNRPKASLIALALLSVMVSSTLAKHQAPLTGGAEEPGEIKVTAKKYEFSPTVITVRKDEHVKLVITALDRDHGFKLEAFNIDQKLKKDEAIAIEFTANKAGTFSFQCSSFCGSGHGKMKGRLVVEDAANPKR